MGFKNDIEKPAKRYFCFLATILFLSCGSLTLFPQSTLAVIPLRTLDGISEAEANMLTTILETGLVKSDHFQIVEKKQIDAVLAAQEQSLEPYIDETFAIKIGKLISAEQIVLGTVSRIGIKYFIAAKIIDITTGKTLKAEKVQADSIETLAVQAETLGHRLAGLTAVFQNGEIESRSIFGELLVTTIPNNTEVLVNGAFKGHSPVLVERVPLGHVRIEARKEGLYGSRELELTKGDLLKVKIALNQRLGRLFIKTENRNLLVILDNNFLDFLGDGLFSDIPEGNHSLILSGKGVFVEEKIVIAPDKTTTVEPKLISVGTLRYIIPEGTTAVIS